MKNSSNTPYTSLSNGKGESKDDDIYGNNNNAIRTQFSQLTEQVKSTVQDYQFDVGYVDMIKPDDFE